MTCGIYKITNKQNEKFYIGSSTNIEMRWCAHKSCLRRNVHSNQHLQNAWNKYGNEEGEFWTPDEKMTEAERKNWKFQRYLKDYLRCVKAADDAIGEMLNYLDKTGLSENTVVIYTSDQGFYLGEHGWFDKRFMYEESMHMPLLIRYPNKIKGGSVKNDMVLNIDYAPTLLNIAGIQAPKNMQGKSFLSILENKSKRIFRDAVY